MKLISNILIGVVLFASCRDAFGPLPIPERAVEFSPSPTYAKWWARIQNCTGTKSPVESISFWVVEDVSEFIQPITGTRVLAYFATSHYIVLASHWMQDEALVEHEMLHAALYQRFGLKYFADDDTDNSHPDEWFKVKCGFVAPK
jgi:hypothetical protein